MGLAGLLLLLAAALFNEALLEALLLEQSAFNPEVRWMIRLAQLALALLGLLVLARRKRGFGALASDWRTVAVVGFNTILVFLALNVLAQLALVVRDDREHSAAKAYDAPLDLYKKDREKIRRVYPGKSDEEILTLIQTPNITDHPALGFMERPIRSKSYNVGLENMRYTGRLDESNAKASLAGGVWMFGGSTLFGHGVADDETIPAVMSALDPRNVYVNFGVQGYDSKLELEKLIILLKKGYRPERVIFFDGINDMLGCLNNDFAPAESPMLRHLAYAHTFNVGTFDRQRGVEAFSRSLPLTRWIMELGIEARPERVTAAYQDLDDPASLYHRDPWLHYKKTAASPFAGKLDELPAYAAKVIERLRQNGMIARALGRSFGFEVVILFQPIGLLSLDNPFVRDPAIYRGGEVFRIIDFLTAAVREAIAKQELDMIDLSRAADACTDCYVDLAHYDARLSGIIAARILALTSPSSH